MGKSSLEKCRGQHSLQEEQIRFVGGSQPALKLVSVEDSMVEVLLLLFLCVCKSRK